MSGLGNIEKVYGEHISAKTFDWQLGGKYVCSVCPPSLRPCINSKHFATFLKAGDEQAFEKLFDPCMTILPFDRRKVLDFTKTIR